MILLKNKRKVAYMILASVFCINMAKFAMSSSNALSIGKDLVRISGKNRYETSIKLFTELKSKKVYLSSGKNFADVLSIGPIAGKEGASIILVDDNDYSFISRMKNNNVKEVVIIGGNKSVSEDLENKVKENFKVTRIAGKDRYETSRKILNMYNKHEVGVATGKIFPDALSAGVFLSTKEMPLLLLSGINSDEVGSHYTVKYTFGGEKSLPYLYGERIAGSDRYETSIKIASKFANKDTIFLCSGRNFPDSLVVTSLASKNKAPIILIDDKKLSIEEKNIISNAKKIFLIGGENSISKSIEENIKNNRLDKIGNIESIDNKNEIPMRLKHRSKNLIDNKSKNELDSKPDLNINPEYVEFIPNKISKQERIVGVKINDKSYNFMGKVNEEFGDFYNVDDYIKNKISLGTLIDKYPDAIWRINKNNKDYTSNDIKKVLFIDNMYTITNNGGNTIKEVVIYKK